MPDIQPLLCTHFRVPDGRLLRHSLRDGGSPSYAVVTKDGESGRWIISTVYETRETAARELKRKAISEPTIEYLIIECEPY